MQALKIQFHKIQQAMQRKQKFLAERKCQVTEIRDKLVKGETGLRLPPIDSHLHHNLLQLKNCISRLSASTKNNNSVRDEEILEFSVSGNQRTHYDWHRAYK